jgi:hypothetical protein
MMEFILDFENLFCLSSPVFVAAFFPHVLVILEVQSSLVLYRQFIQNTTCILLLFLQTLLF